MFRKHLMVLFKTFEIQSAQTLQIIIVQFLLKSLLYNFEFLLVVKAKQSGKDVKNEKNQASTCPPETIFLCLFVCLFACLFV